MPQLISIPSTLVQIKANDHDAKLFDDILDCFIQQGVEDKDAIPFLKGQYYKEENFTFYHLGEAMTQEGARCVFLGMSSEGAPPFLFLSHKLLPCFLQNQTT